MGLNSNLPKNYKDLTDEQKRKLGDILGFMREFKLIGTRIEDFCWMVSVLLAVHDSFSELNNTTENIDITEDVDQLDEVIKEMIDILNVHCPGIKIKMTRKDL